MLQYWQINILYVKHLWHIRVTTLLLGNFEAPRTIGSTAVSDQSYSLWSSHGTLAQPQDYSFFQLLPVCLERLVFHIVTDFPVLLHWIPKMYLQCNPWSANGWEVIYCKEWKIISSLNWYVFSIFDSCRSKELVSGWLRCSWQGVQFNIWRATFMDHIHFGLQLFIVTVVAYFGFRFVISSYHIGAKPL